MSVRRRIGIIAHVLFGLLFPYTFIGSVMLIYGFMVPSTPKEKLTGTAIAVLFLAILITVNILTLKGLPRRTKAIGVLIHLFAFAISALLMFIWLRFK